MPTNMDAAPADLPGMGPRPAQPPKPRKSPSNTRFEPIVAFYIFLAAGLFAAFFSPIQDCDEVFNYWEPSHYLNHGYGLQTWEYSPVYAIRSWTYAGLHSTVIWFGTWLPMVGSDKTRQFYFLRVALAFACAGCEAKLFSVIQRTLNPRVAITFLVVMATSTGMFHAATAYLPSTFAMYMTMLGLAAFMDWRGGLRTATGIMYFGIGSTLGWPFAGILVLPFIAEEIFFASITKEIDTMVRRLLDGTVRTLIVLALQTAIDVFFYKIIACVPLNIVMYNIFGGSGKGPNIYGTEPWHFYLRNLTLNFNAWLILALAAMPVLFFHHKIGKQAATRQSFIRNLVFTSPMYLWMLIFTLQPHKEERFMYPIYPLIAFNAALSLHVILVWLGSATPKDLLGKIPTKARFGAVVLFVLLALDISLLRTFGMITAYSAPLKVFEPLKAPGAAVPGDTVCFGKEWYRFPSSFFLPNNMKAKFIKSDFRGLLPGEFSEANVGFGFFPGAWLVPPGMNDGNVEDPGKYTDIEFCSYLVDSYLPGSPETMLEPHYVKDSEHWERVSCAPFLDSSSTGVIGRTLWIPDYTFVPDRHRRKWGEFCLLKRKTQV